MKERFCCGPKSKKVSPSVSAPLHLILQAPTPASHEWRRVPTVKRLCQLCHLVVDGQGVRCKSCGLNAHSQCGNYYPVNISSVQGTSNLNHPNNKYNNGSNLITTAGNCSKNSGGIRSTNPESNFEPRIKKLLHVSIPNPPHSSHSDHSTRLSSCGDSSVAASTAIVVGTATVSTETPRSESKTPEITITPGSEVGEDPGSEERVPLPDSGCGDLIISSETDGVSQNSSTPRGRSQNENNYSSPEVILNTSSSSEKGGGEGLVNGSGRIHYVDGPLDGALYALVNTVKPKPPSSADSGISVTADQMKDLDRLLSALVQEADSIPDIPYHARQDSLPFSYGVPSSETLKQRQEQQFRQQTKPSGFGSQFEPQQQSWRHLSEGSGQPKQTISSATYYPRPIPISAPAKLPSTISSSNRRPENLESEDRVFFDTFDSQHPHSHHHSSPPPLPHQTTTTSYYSQPDKLPQSHSGPRVHHLHLELEDQIIPHSPGGSSTTTTVRTGGTGRNWENDYRTPPPTTSYRQPQTPLTTRNHPIEYYNPRNLQREFNSGHSYTSSSPGQYQHYHYPPQQRGPSTSASFHNFSGVSDGGSGRRIMRSQSADGRPQDENADEWLARQKRRLEEKRAKKHVVKNDWLVELKRALPPQQQQDEERTYESQYLQQSGVRPSSTRHQTSTVSAPRSNVSTPGLYSSDDEEFDREVEREMYPSSPYYQSQNRGRKIQRYHSESAYDRVQRAPSQQSNTSTIGGMGDYTPGFPTCPPTPYLNRPVSPGKPPRSPKLMRRSGMSTPTTPTTSVNEWMTTMTPTEPRSQTPVNPRPVYMVESEVKFAKDLSSYWYKPNASREETISALRYQAPGVFIVRNSNSFPGAYGLAIKVNESSTVEESVRHFLIEPTRYGVRLRGSAVEPVFGSLSALVYAHSIEPLALPTTLALPTSDIVLPVSQSQSTTAHLLTQGAACQLLFLGVVGVECITGDEAVTRAVATVSLSSPPTVISLRLSKQGLTLTDTYRQRFFRLHFPLKGISYAALDPSNRTIAYGNQPRKLFAVVARSPSAAENSCVVLAELEEGQPANAIVAFFQRVIAWQS